MTLIIIIAAILIERFWQVVKDHCQKNYFGEAVDFLLDAVPDTVKNNQWLFLAILLVVPFIVVYLAHLILLNILGGLFALLFDIALLLVCISYKFCNEKVETFIAAQQDNDQTKCAETFYDMTGEHIDSVERPNSYLTRLLFLESRRGWFGVVFYFVLLGPAGVVLYRSLQDFIRSEKTQALHDKLQQIMAYINWPLSRLVALTFFLSGSFDDALKGWKGQQAYLEQGDRLMQGNTVEQGNQVAILSTGCAAVSHDAQDETHNDTAYVQAAQGMLSRSLIIWCAVIAIMTLTGVFV